MHVNYGEVFNLALREVVKPGDEGVTGAYCSIVYTRGIRERQYPHSQVGGRLIHTPIILIQGRLKTDQLTLATLAEWHPAQVYKPWGEGEFNGFQKV